MSGRELQYYLMESGLFKVDIPCYMIEVDKSGRVFNQIPTSYKGFSMGKIEIEEVIENKGVSYYTTKSTSRGLTSGYLEQGM